MPYAQVLISDTPKRQCLACDWKKGWAMVGGDCYQTTEKKCFAPVNHLRTIPYRFLSRDVAYIPCGICEDKLLVNIQGQCEKLDPLLQILNCKKYRVFEEDIQCAVCDQGFFNRKGTCVSAGNPIANCEIMQELYEITPSVDPTDPANQTNDTIVCLKCLPKFHLSNDLQRCIVYKPDVKNCVAWTSQYCIKCLDSAATPGQSDNRNVAAIAELAYVDTPEKAPTAPAFQGSFYENNIF